MTDSNPLANIGELSKPATVFIEKISDAVGGIFKPWQIRRVAKAEGEAKRIEAVAQIEITKLQKRALTRLVIEEANKQSNIESITRKALLNLDKKAKPENMEDDWITNFFDKCRLISDEEMQVLWSKVLAGEANSPGGYSKRTINLLGSLDKSDANLFKSLCGFSWIIGDLQPIVFSDIDEIYNKCGINFSSLKHLDEIGLVSFEGIAGYVRKMLPKKFSVFYFGEPLNIEFEMETENQLETGKILLSKAGKELAPICGAESVQGFYEYVFKKWKELGFKVISPNHIIEQAQPNNASS